MHDRDNMPDEVPVADAVAQDQETTPTAVSSDQPMEANARDWQEQLQEVVGIDDDREEYR